MMKLYAVLFFFYVIYRSVADGVLLAVKLAKEGFGLVGEMWRCE